MKFKKKKRDNLRKEAAENKDTFPLSQPLNWEA